MRTIRQSSRIVLRAAAVLTLLVSCQNWAALANDWPENDETCARLSSLVTVADIEKVVGRKGVTIEPASAERSDGCTVSIDVPEAKTPGPNVSAISLTLRQYISEKEARESVQQGVAMAGGPEKAVEIAVDERGAAFLIKFGFDYATASVDATELTVNVRDRTLKGPQVAKDLGELVFRRALASESIASYTAHSHELAGYVGIGPLLKLVERCSKDDIPAHDQVRKIFANGRLNKITIPAVADMSAYTQRWIAIGRYEEMMEKRLQPIQQGTVDTLTGECAKMADELPAFEKTLHDKLIKALSK